jgi:hypothetical protein
VERHGRLTYCKGSTLRRGSTSLACRGGGDGEGLHIMNSMGYLEPQICSRVTDEGTISPYLLYILGGLMDGTLPVARFYYRQILNSKTLRSSESCEHQLGDLHRRPLIHDAWRGCFPIICLTATNKLFG